MRPILYVDDGYPESRDYDDNYVAVDVCQLPEPRGLQQVLRRLWSRIGGERDPVSPAPLRRVPGSAPA